jgi:hypothetical protein
MILLHLSQCLPRLQDCRTGRNGRPVGKDLLEELPRFGPSVTGGSPENRFPLHQLHQLTKSCGWKPIKDKLRRPLWTQICLLRLSRVLN